MSLEYSLELGDELRAPPPSDRPASGLWWRAGTTDTRAVDLVHLRYGFVPVTWLHFRVGPGDVGAQHDEMVAIVAAALEATTGDAVLHADFEDIWLVRRHGDLVLSDDDTRWPEVRRAPFAGAARAPLDDHRY